MVDEEVVVVGGVGRDKKGLAWWRVVCLVGRPREHHAVQCSGMRPSATAENAWSLVYDSRVAHCGHIHSLWLSLPLPGFRLAFHSVGRPCLL